MEGGHTLSDKQKKRYYWLKLKENFFEEDTIEWLEEQPNGKEYCLIYLKLCLKSLKTDGVLVRNVGSMLIPYDAETLARVTNSTVDTVKVAMDLFKKIGLIQLLDTGEIYINQLNELVGSETEAAKQKRLQRSKVDNVPKLSSECPENVAQSIELEYRDKSIEKDNKEEPKKSPCKYSDEHLRLAQKLQNNLINDFPSEMKRVNIEKWADTFRLIEERDQQTIAAIDYVLDWLPTNSFWFGNIRSASKLRTQFEKLKFEIKNEKERGQQRAAYQRQNVRTENLPEWAKEPNNQQEEKLSPEEQAELDRQIKEYLEGK
ncbi:TPA: phage replisome organizer N-terminal domain-containing protein [Enterococcus faecalis]|uniref:phage replisome organizer N-terminal domain-containing protein n=1 Tax=Enterococcus TaxID=1350 RepID=UPI0001CB2BED|nr:MULTISPECIES: phage replisome organizer N-terminal domain-containing protein [Enterococcus]ETJ09395.1 MAG: Phage protein [Enterococcus faecalis DORA_14]DAP21051.1 MAG TPA: replisome organizer [Caudoviricetes sp.]HAP3746079.1 phage replisome organizer [Enterococcus faecalis TDR28]HAP3752057.1 phage replisome organizer [Enterococcus faecalis TDR22]HAP3754853.1 phage replisome organizer [Enterococcus faecalis TDR13]HAP3758073.1 phage replisome organizer [Enterococcus faecalis TDR7]HAP3769250